MPPASDPATALDLGPIVSLPFPRMGDDIGQHILQGFQLFDAHAQAFDDGSGDADRLGAQVLTALGQADLQGAFIGRIAVPLDQPGVLQTLQQRRQGGRLQLQQLAQLKQKGILTEEEFTAKKKQILGI